MAVTERYEKQLLHLTSCKRCRKLQANHFEQCLRSFKRKLFSRCPSTFKHRWI